MLRRHHDQSVEARASSAKLPLKPPEFPGDYCEREPPDPFPNSEVKTFCADGSVAVGHVRVGHCQGPNSEPRPALAGRGFVFLASANRCFWAVSGRFLRFLLASLRLRHQHLSMWSRHFLTAMVAVLGLATGVAAEAAQSAAAFLRQRLSPVGGAGHQPGTASVRVQPRRRVTMHVRQTERRWRR